MSQSETLVSEAAKSLLYRRNKQADIIQLCRHLNQLKGALDAADLQIVIRHGSVSLRQKNRPEAAKCDENG